MVAITDNNPNLARPVPNAFPRARPGPRVRAAQNCQPKRPDRIPNPFLLYYMDVRKRCGGRGRIFQLASQCADFWKMMPQYQKDEYIKRYQDLRQAQLQQKQQAQSQQQAQVPQQQQASVSNVSKPAQGQDPTTKLPGQP